MAALLGRIGRAHRGLHGDKKRRAERTCTAERSGSGRSVSGGRRGAAILFRDAKARSAGGK